MAETAFLTGFPGFIGRRLVAGLLARDPEQRVAALVEPRMMDAARAAAAEMPGGERIELLPGDIATRGLGLAPSDWERLAGELTSAFHLAAIYDLATPLEAAQRVNVDGTGNVLELCAAATGLRRFNYVSTAYVAGLRRGVVYEHELSLGQGFKNHYESTKFQAEVWVRQAMDRIPTTITRPAIVVGDSRTGETQKFDGPYYVLRTVAVAVARGMPVMGFGHPGSPFNVVPVDFVVEAILAADLEPSAEGRTLHLVDPEPLNARELVELLARTYAGAEVRGHVPSWVLDVSLRSKAMRTLFGGTPRESIRYLNHPVRFDTRVAEDVLRAAGVRPPRFPEYVRPVVEFFRTHEGDASFAPPRAA
jgi:thioester reductase-like protein